MLQNEEDGRLHQLFMTVTLTFVLLCCLVAHSSTLMHMKKSSHPIKVYVVGFGPVLISNMLLALARAIERAASSSNSGAFDFNADRATPTT